MTKMPAPSARTKPSRSLSNGRLAFSGESFRSETARAEMNPPKPIGVMAASEPPVIMMSASLCWIARMASPIALAAEAQAVATAMFGPRRPKWMEIWPEAAFTMSFGITNGLMRLGPSFMRRVCCSSYSLRPPMPLPIMTPERVRSSLAKSSPLSLTASIAPTKPNWAKRSSRLAVRGSSALSGSKSRTWPPNLTLCCETSNKSMRPMPLLPAQRFFQYVSTSWPKQLTVPIPVMTTRRLIANLASWRLFVLQFLFDVFNRLADSLDFLCRLVGNGDFEFFFELHHQLDSIQRVGIEVLDERRIFGYLVFADPHLFAHDFNHAFFSGRHVVSPPGQRKAVRC